jgi:hypothetical protein
LRVDIAQSPRSPFDLMEAIELAKSIGDPVVQKLVEWCCYATTIARPFERYANFVRARLET